MKYLFILILLFLYSCSATSGSLRHKTFSAKTKSEKSNSKTSKTTKTKNVVSHTTPKKVISKVNKIIEKHFDAINRSSGRLPHLNSVFSKRKQEVVFTVPKFIDRRSSKQMWSVQTTATSDKSKAETAKNTLTLETNINAKIVQDGSIYKVRIGLSENRVEMDQLAGELKLKGYKSAWVVNETVKVNSAKELSEFFTLQVGVYSSQISASSFKKNLEMSIDEPIIIKQVNQLYKVYAGSSDKRELLDDLKKKLAGMGHKAWVTKIK